MFILRRIFNWTTEALKLKAAITFSLCPEASNGRYCVILQKDLFVDNNAVRIANLVFIWGIVVVINVFSNSHYLYELRRFHSGNIASHQTKITKNLCYVDGAS
jgi:hypothetical protein